MSVATITTDINIGPFKIPANGQNMIMNNYAQRKNFKVEFVIPEPMMSNRLATIQWCHKDYKFSQVILCSIHQLPKEEKHLNDLISNMSEVEFHFALEGISGKGKDFLVKCLKEATIFQDAKKLDSSKTDWLGLYNLSKSSNEN
jgi:sporadic carbohydrate cluster protein (TIGR04323 family)